MDSDPKQHMAETVPALGVGSALVETLEHAVQMSVDVVDHCDMAGVSVPKSGRVRTLAASNDLLRIIDDLQFQLREGPCFDTLGAHDTVTANDLASDPRWPRWGALISERTGAHSSMSFPLSSDGDLSGALNMYSTRPAGFGHEDALLGYVVAAHTSVAVAQDRKVEQLTHASDCRTVVGQATGILMERFGVDAMVASGVLRRIAQTHNIELATLAAELVAHGHLPDRGCGADGPGG